jgi:threonine dehydratase
MALLQQFEAELELAAQRQHVVVGDAGAVDTAAARGSSTARAADKLRVCVFQFGNTLELGQILGLRLWPVSFLGGEPFSRMSR